MATEVLETPSRTDSVYGHQVVLFNDDHNDFIYVALCLMTVCGKDQDQAKEITMKVHNEGKATCYEGSLEECETVSEKLNDVGLTSEAI